jgi:hypothetical protein
MEVPIAATCQLSATKAYEAVGKAEVAAADLEDA